jgi:hypothetical protein
MKKMHSVYAALLGLTVLIGSTTAQAIPVTIDFEGFDEGTMLDGDIEDGFVLTDLGRNPGGVTAPGGGTGGPTSMGFGPPTSGADPLLQLVSQDGGLFEFLSLESYFTLNPAIPTSVLGFLNNVLVGIDIFDPTGPAPDLSGPIVPAQFALNLAGVQVDTLWFDMNASLDDFEGAQAIDNIRLSTAAVPVPVPVPSTLLLLGMALLGSTRVRRTR